MSFVLPPSFVYDGIKNKFNDWPWVETIVNIEISFQSKVNLMDLIKTKPN
jgi:hypothetical protein